MTRYRHIACWALLFLSATTSLVRADPTITTSRMPDGARILRIDQPEVRSGRWAPSPAVSFVNGDRVTVQAGGCVQTGGRGSTWKRYVDAIGSNSDRLYRGTISIPGATDNFVPIASVLGRTLEIARGPTTLSLGYLDDDYSDNGYWGHDDGNDGQCKGLGNAYVIITINRRNAETGQAVSGAFDLYPAGGYDPNGIWRHPRWRWKDSHSAASDFPDADQLCAHFPLGSDGTLVLPAGCTTQAPSIDTPRLPDWQEPVCNVAGPKDRVFGHVNWWAASFQGRIAWADHSHPIADDDYNMFLTKIGRAKCRERV